jgi:hypothetical protein
MDDIGKKQRRRKEDNVWLHINLKKAPDSALLS